uniref:DUSP domain-containing protein n=1 Tax=Rhizochromulina marina TaxID=1034831 RepID=A0A7S2SS60_9STRA|mmetsp:Transcript_5/g.13  ORF Transcript_5/g.13 Transcript_5/m.13 type:complete len:418 (+) Transcript_5:32-1285(+)
MGGALSKGQDKERLTPVGEDNKGLLETAEPAFTFYDQFGILRKGVKTDDGKVHDRDEELERVLSLEDTTNFTPEEKAVWYIVEAGWIRTWLSYVRFGTQSLGTSLSSPAPGPINNESLLIMCADEEATTALPEGELPLFKWIPREGLVAAGKDVQGHFRRVNCKVWEAFCDMYEGSGPAIKVDMLAIKERKRLELEAQLAEKLNPELATSENKEEEEDGEGKEEGDKEDADLLDLSTEPPETKPPPPPAPPTPPLEDKQEIADEEAAEAKAEADEDEDDEDDEEDWLDPNNKAWQETENWDLDQSQERFTVKFSKKHHPKKSLAQLEKLHRDAWTRRKLRKDEVQEAAPGGESLGDGEEEKKEGDPSDEASKPKEESKAEDEVPPPPPPEPEEGGLADHGGSSAMDPGEEGLELAPV